MGKVDAMSMVALGLAASGGGGGSNPPIEPGDAGKVLKVNQQETGTYWGDDGNEPAAYIKDASVSDNTLTLTKKDDTTVTYTGGGSSYTAGDGIDITNNVISVEDDYVAPGARQLVSNDGVLQDSSFISRTTGGTASITADGVASFAYWKGNSVNSTRVEASATLVDPVNATVDSATYIAYAVSQGDTTGTKTFNADDADYGVLLNGDESATVSYVAFNAGTIVNATPTSFTSLGFNLYDHSNTRAYVIQGNRYQVFGTYTSVGSETIEDDVVVGSYTIPHSFEASTTGYVSVVGGNSTDTMIALVWSGYNYAHTYEEYSASTISFTDVTSWGMPKVNDVADEIDFDRQKYVKRIGRDVVANKDNYDVKIWDSTYVYYVLDNPVETSLTITQSYSANDFGEEIFNGTTVPVEVRVMYGQNLVDKLRTDVMTLSQQTISDAQFTQVMSNLGLGAARDYGRETIINQTSLNMTGTGGLLVNYSTVSDFTKKFSLNDSVKISLTLDGTLYEIVKPVTSLSSGYIQVVANLVIPTGTITNIQLWNTYGYVNFDSYVNRRLTTFKLETKEKNIITKISSDYVAAPILESDVGTIYSASCHNQASPNSVVIGSGARGSATTTAGASIVAIGPDADGNEYGVAVGNGSYAYYHGVAVGRSARAGGNGSGVAIGDAALAAGGTGNGSRGVAIGASTVNTCSTGGGVAIGAYNLPYDIDNSNYDGTKTYNTGDIICYYSSYYKSLQDNNIGHNPSATSGVWWQTITYAQEFVPKELLLSIGNGTSSNYSNILEINKDLKLKSYGDIEAKGNVIATNIPAAPASDGNYVLKCSIVSGVATYSWVAES